MSWGIHKVAMVGEPITVNLVVGSASGSAFADDRLQQSSSITTIRPLSQFDFRSIRLGGVAFLEAKRDFLICLDVVFCGLCQPVPFSLGFAQRALTALGFQLA